VSDKKDKHRDGDRGEPRTGSVSPADASLTDWLQSLWAREDYPEEVQVFQSFGRNGQDRGKMILHRTYRANTRLDVEMCTHLANEIIATAQIDADSVGRKSLYEIAIIDKNRRAVPLVRRLGPITPQQSYLVRAGEGASGGGGDDDEEEEYRSHGRNLGLAYTDRFFSQIQYEKQRADAVIGDLLGLQRSIIHEHRDFEQKLMGQVMGFFSALQESEDRRLDRDLARKKAELWMGIARDGVRTARNLIPAIFGQYAGAEPQPQIQGAGQPQMGAGAAPPRIRASREQVLVDNFLNDCDETEISIQLFGDWEEKEGRLHQTKEGIFSKEQFAVLMGVRNLILPPEALDVLLPDSGDPRALTPAQIATAQPLMTDGTATALIELIGLRQAAKAQAQSQPVAQKEKTTP